MVSGRKLVVCLSIVFALAGSGPAMAAEGGDAKTRIGVTVKSGLMAMLDDEQTVDYQSLSFDRSSSGLFGLEIEGRIMRDFGLVVGGESLRFKLPYTVGAGSAERRFRAETTGHFIKAKYLFEVSESLQPYAGIGWGTVDIKNQSEAPIDHDTSGDVMQGVVGLQWRNDQFGVRLEYFHLDGKSRTTQATRSA